MKLVIDLQGAQTESRLRGIGRQVRTLAKSMIAQASAHDAMIVLNSGLPDGLDDLQREFGDILPRENIKIFDIPADVFERDSQNLWRMRAAELMRESFIAGLKPDVLHLTSLFEGVNDNAVTSVGLMQSDYATAVTLFDLIPLYDPAKYLGAESARRFYYRRAQSLKRADLLLAISESARREAVDMLSIPPERIEVALLAADDSFRAREVPPAERAFLRLKYQLPESFVLYVGAIEARKNVSLILEAFGKLPSGLRERHALVFGGRLHAPERLQLRAAACRFGVEPDCLVLPGYIEEGDLPAVYGLCDLFVFPSMHEGFGLPPLEAMACGAPVLAARNSSLPEVMGRDDLLFGTFDADELAAKMQRILTDGRYAASLRAWSIKQAGQFSWEQTGQKAIGAIEHLHEQRPRKASRGVMFRRRPRLAFFSPLPSDQSGIADHSVELLKELARFYDVECIIKNTVVNEPWLTANFVFRDVDFFKRHVHSFDRIVYCLGNSDYHAHMFPLVEAHPGVVILHDFFLSGIHDWLGNVGQAPEEDFLRELYITHGLPALRYVANHGREAAAKRYAANRVAFEESYGVLVHSRLAVEMGGEIYGPAAARKMVQLPLLRATQPAGQRDAARQRLGIAQGEFLVCTLGFVAKTKLSDKLYEAWAASRVGRGTGSRLVFVGANAGGAWGDELAAAIDGQPGQGRAEILGFVSSEIYQDYLAAADLAIQLRTDSRGETSRAVLDCMAAGIPVIVNAHGTARELPDATVLKIPDRFSKDELVRAIDMMHMDPARRAALGAKGQDHIRIHHHPAKVGEAVFDAIERFHTAVDGARQTQLLEGIRELYAGVLPSEADFRRVSEVIACGMPRFGLRRILFDVTLLAERDTHTGIERVVRSMLVQLMAEPPPGYRLEPVRIEGGNLVFARNFVSMRFGIPSNVLPDCAVDWDAGDVYLMLEWAADRLPDLANWLQRFRRGGGRVVIGINDLLPMIMPHRFPPHIGPIAERWFETVLLVADQLVCISRTVADTVLQFGNGLSEGRNGPIAVDYYHCAADIKSSLPTTGLPEGAAALLATIKQRKTFIMVGTIEPRKGHKLVLEALDLLWSQGIDAGLVIVGKAGWMIDSVEQAISRSPERGTRLHWLSGISDEFLELLYASCSALIAASEGEGFGLPIVEAAHHGLPVIARDIPVFREIGGQYASFFDGTTAEGLASTLKTWLAARRRGAIHAPGPIETLSWKDSAGQLMAALSTDTHYGMIDRRKARGAIGAKREHRYEDETIWDGEDLPSDLDAFAPGSAGGGIMPELARNGRADA